MKITDVEPIVLRLPQMYSVAHSPLVNGILQEQFVLKDGCLAVPSGPGLGVELDEDALLHHRVA